MILNRPRRRAAVTLEAAFVYPVMLLLLLGLVVGGLGVFRYLQVCAQSREAARWISVRGSDWQKETGNSSPTAQQALQNAVVPLAAGMDTSKLSIQVQLIDRVNGTATDWDSSTKAPTTATTSRQAVTNRVRVTVRYRWSPELFLTGPITLTSTAELPMSF